MASTDSPDPVSQGNNITYTQSVTNNGPTAVANATFTDIIPTNTTLFSFTPPANWTCNTIAVGSTGTFTCTLTGTLAVGASVNFPLVVKVNPTTAPGTTITNSPNVTSTVGDPNTANNTVSVTSIVASPTQADVSIIKTASPEPVNQGTNLAYTLRVTNAGPATALGVTVYRRASRTGRGKRPSSPPWVLAPIPLVPKQFRAASELFSVGRVAVITINATANTFSSASLSTNTATVTATTSDPNSANNTSSAVTSIQAPHRRRHFFVPRVSPA